MSQLHPSSSSKKRKADDGGDETLHDRMSMSPAPRHRTLPAPHRPLTKRSRTEPLARPLSLPRLLETLDAPSLRLVLSQLCERHPDMASEIQTTSPRPSVASALAVLKTYEEKLQASFPFGGDHTSDYAYNRVKYFLLQLLEALSDFVPHFLPPNESQISQSLNFLDGATATVHALPEWQTFQNNLHKQEAYEEMDKAWVVTIREAAKRAGGMPLKYEGWEQKLAKHNITSGGRLSAAVEELSKAVGWIGSVPAGQAPHSDELSAVRQELLSGNYGASVPVRVGPW